MQKLLIGLASLAAIAAVTPASAQGVYFNAPGVSVGVGAPAYREHVYEYDRPRYRVHRHYHDSYAYSPRCRTVTIQRDNGSMKRIRRCD